LFLDFDGTLVAIAARPDEVQLSSRVESVLDRLSTRVRTRVVVLSGRPKRDLERFFHGKNIALLGSHGYEMALPVEIAPLVERARSVFEEGVRDLQRSIARIEGVWIEAKPSGATVHYRQADPAQHESVREIVHDWLGAEPARIQALILRPARRAVEIRPRAEWGKGEAARWYLEAAGPAEVRGALPLAAGDDDTDEDMFRIFSAEGFTVRVADESEPTLAIARVAEPPALWEWLEEIDQLRAKTPTD
jgi:trehalose 6-phosphate phosphatase